MADIKLGEGIYAGVTAVKLNTTDGGTVTFEAGGSTDLTPIVEAVEALGGTVETPSVAGIVASIEETATIIDILKNPWEQITEEGEDALGKYYFSTTVSPENVVNDLHNGYWRLRPGFTGKISAPNPGNTGRAIDITNIGSSDLQIFQYTSNTQIFGHTLSRRVIFPETCKLYSYTMYYAAMSLYLPKHCDGKNNSMWIGLSDSRAGRIVKCPEGADIPYYLNRLGGLTAEYMVGIFENMIDRSGETTSETITLGSTNLAKLTEEQKEIAYAKGWNLA